MTYPKPVEFRGSSLDDLRAFPATAKREAGHQIDLVQNGKNPDDWKPMAIIGSGVKSIASRKKVRRPANTISIWQRCATAI